MLIQLKAQHRFLCHTSRSTFVVESPITIYLYNCTHWFSWRLNKGSYVLLQSYFRIDSSEANWTRLRSSSLSDRIDVSPYRCVAVSECRGVYRPLWTKFEGGGFCPNLQLGFSFSFIPNQIGGVLHKFVVRVQFLFHSKPNWRGVMPKFRSVDVDFYPKTR